MRNRFMIAAVVSVAFSFSMVGQTSSSTSAAKSKAYTPPKTPWGEPDLQGNWPAQFNIPRERGANATVLSDEEVAQKQAQTAKQFEARQQAPANTGRVTIGPPSNFSEIALP